MPSGHFDEEQLERYSLGLTPEPELAQIEEHLLICEECQNTLARTDAYVRAMRAASARVEEENRAAPRAIFPKLAWAGAAAAGMVVLLAGSQWLNLRRPAPAQVALAAVRGPEAVFASAPAGRPLVLVMESDGLPAHASYAIEIVDASGGEVWRGAAAARAGRITATAAGLSAGRYYARVYSPSRELLREYGVEAR